MSYQIAIDGPAGAGKSTIAKKVAKLCKGIYIDTGAMYRAMAYHMLKEEVCLEDTAAIIHAAGNADIKIAYQEGQQVVLLNGENVNDYIRTEKVGNTASVVSAIPEVRKILVQLQKQLAETNDCVMDGRDIGTCVLPKADVKIYLTASSTVRAKRRYLELQEKGIECNLEEIQKDIEDRDYRDMNRSVSPLRQAEDAVLIDSSDDSIDDVVDKILKLCNQKR